MENLFDKTSNIRVNCSKCGKPTGLSFAGRLAMSKPQYNRTFMDEKMIENTLCDKCQSKVDTAREKADRWIEKNFKKEFALKRCNSCDGTGKIKGYTCMTCSGKGDFGKYQSNKSYEDQIREKKYKEFLN